MRNQSPINIDETTAIRKTYPQIVMSGHSETTTKLTLINTGHNVEIQRSVDSPEAFLSGGPLEATYKFLQLHFHWGSTDEAGSEHSINGNFYPMEAHFVHYNQKYQNMEKSMKESDGVAVVAIFLDLTSKLGRDNRSAIKGIANYLPNVTTVGAKVAIPPDVLSWVENYSRNEYYTYHGSLSTHPFTENVIWLIYPIPVTVSKEEIGLFRRFKSLNGRNLRSNQRETQLLNGRQVYLVTNSSEPRNHDENRKGESNTSRNTKS